MGVNGAPRVKESRGGCESRDARKFTQVYMDFTHHSRRNTFHDVAQRSLSPWKYTQKPADPDQYPETIPEAVCLHQGCVDEDGQVDMGLNSVPILHDTFVLKKVKDKCGIFFRLEKKTITVGCTCVRPMIV
nr:PREDICTED: interleukin-17F-like isoform X2 [Lepisosteus oculatus]